MGFRQTALCLMALAALCASAAAQPSASPPPTAFAPRIPSGDKDGEALLLAAQKGDDAKVLALLEKGVPIGSKEDDGFTALQLAASNRHSSTVKLLLDHGSDAHSIYGNAALWLAAGGILDASTDNPPPVLPKFTFTKKSLRMHPGYLQKYRRQVIQIKDKWLIGDYNIIQMLLAHGADVNASFSHGETVLMRATFGCSPSIIGLLLAHGASINVQNSNGETSLIYASMLPGDPDKTVLLLKSGANPNLCDKAGHNALYYALQNRSFWDQSTIALLKNATQKTDSPHFSPAM